MLDAKLIKGISALLKHCKDRNNPRYELNGVLVTGNKLICTDTKQLLELEFADEFTANGIQHPILLCEDRALLVHDSTRPADYLSILDANGGLIDDLDFKLAQLEYGTFPDISRVSQIEDSGVEIEEFCEQITFSQCISYRNTWIDPKLLQRFIELVAKLNPISVTVKQRDKNQPLALVGICEYGGIRFGYKYVVMPILQNRDEND